MEERVFRALYSAMFMDIHGSLRLEVTTNPVWPRGAPANTAADVLCAGPARLVNADRGYRTRLPASYDPINVQGNLQNTADFYLTHQFKRENYVNIKCRARELQS